MTDLLRRPAVLRLTPGNVADVTMAADLLDAAGPVRCLLADKGYDANTLRKRLEDETRYKGRWRIEAAFCRLR